MKPNQMSSRLNASSVNFLVRYNPRHTIPTIASRYLTAPGHPLRPKISHMWDIRSKDELWWRVNIDLQLSRYKRVIRSWAARRARLAFTQALAHHGLDTTGHPLPSASNTPPDPLLGSMEIFVLPPSLTHKVDVLQEDANYLLQVILNRKKLREQRAEAETGAK
ncbi:hypothetical protein PENSTE_c019G01816 [Penicillium steckii]|uniref:Uncharacterized protein n=1 Tax=Penicillium steckii TaxID=303698 RepID=A0A1V6SW35_9EURO|nr:hypothetical protein PENSTE_c019G01816 [Penicillium steckii]